MYVTQTAKIEILDAYLLNEFRVIFSDIFFCGY
jgi:hypothetical protein